MSQKKRTRFPGVLFSLTLASAMALATFVFLAPSLHAGEPGNNILRIFALDNTVRRTSLASALGLAVTAVVFFRPVPSTREKKLPGKRRPPVNIPGA